MSSNKPGNSFLRNASYVFPVKLLSNTKSPINLLPITPHYTFTVNLLWKSVTLVSCGLSWDHVCTFCELFTPSRVKDASSVNKMTPKFRDLLVFSGTIPYVAHVRLVPDVVPFVHDTDISLPHVTFATPVHVIRPCERPLYGWTNVDFSEPSEECSLVC